jgi:hypothetical protein
MRESSSGCKDDEDTPVCSAQPRNKDGRKGTHQQVQKVGNSTKDKKGIACTSSNSRHFIKPVSHGMFLLKMLLVSIRKGLLRFLYLSQC